MGSDIRFSFVHCNAQTLYTLPYLISQITFFIIIVFNKLPHIVFFFYNIRDIKNLSFIFIL